MHFSFKDFIRLVYCKQVHMPKKRTSNANLFLLLINDSVSEIKTT